VPSIFSNVDAILREERDLGEDHLVEDDLILKEVSVDATFLGKGNNEDNNISYL
jgi:hypothetical protein